MFRSYIPRSLPSGALLCVLVFYSVIMPAPIQSQNNATAVSTLPTVETVTVISKPLQLQVQLPGELAAFQSVALYPMVQSFVSKMHVDRGSMVRKDALLIELVAPEISARRLEAEAGHRSAEATLQQASAEAATSAATYERLRKAAATPGVVAGNELETVQRTMEAGAAKVRALEAAAKAAEEAARAMQEIEEYLHVRAPFDGVVTERNVHEGSLVAPSPGGAQPPMLRLAQVARLRLTINVPEGDVAGIRPDTKLQFTVPAYPGEIFTGTVRRIAHALDLKTRTMPVEMDVNNDARRLAPGMYADVTWNRSRQEPSLFVPASAVAVTTERIFVIRIRNGKAEYVNVKRGVTMGGMIEVFGEITAGDTVALKASDELREGVTVNTVAAAQ